MRKNGVLAQLLITTRKLRAAAANASYREGAARTRSYSFLVYFFGFPFVFVSLQIVCSFRFRIQ
jgi:hypothetical protein